MTEHVFGVSLIVIPFVVIVVLALRHESRKDKNRQAHFQELARVLNGKLISNQFGVDVTFESRPFRIQYFASGESDADKLCVRTDIKPWPDHVLFVLSRGVNRWLSKKITTGDEHFDKRVAYQIQPCQKSPRTGEAVQKVCTMDQAKTALLSIQAQGFNEVRIPGAFREGSFSANITDLLTGFSGLEASVDNPKSGHYEVTRIQEIMRALRQFQDVLPEIST